MWEGNIMEPPPDEKPPEPTQNTYGNLTKETFYSSIEEVIKIEPLTSSSIARYTFNFDFGGKKGNLEINATDLMRGYKKFEELLFSHFDITLPSKMKAKPEPGVTSEWNKFVRYCAASCTKIQPEESVEWEEIDRLLEYISGFNIFDESQKDEWGNKNTRYFFLEKVDRGTKYYCLKSSDAAQIFKDLNIIITREDMGKIMKQRGIKRKGTGNIKISGKYVTAWWLTEKSLIEHGLEPEKSKIPVMVGGLYDNL